MAKNTPEGRKGAVNGRTQFLDVNSAHWVKRDAGTGENLGTKADHKPYKGVAKEPDGRRR